MKAAILFICCFVLYSCSEHKLVKDFDKHEVPKSATDMEGFLIDNEEENAVRQKNANAKLVYANNLVKVGDYQIAIDIYQEVFPVQAGPKHNYLSQNKTAPIRKGSVPHSFFAQFY